MMLAASCRLVPPASILQPTHLRTQMDTPGFPSMPLLVKGKWTGAFPHSGCCPHTCINIADSATSIALMHRINIDSPGIFQSCAWASANTPHIMPAQIKSGSPPWLDADFLQALVKQWLHSNCECRAAINAASAFWWHCTCNSQPCIAYITWQTHACCPPDAWLESTCCECRQAGYASKSTATTDKAGRLHWLNFVR